MKAGRPPMKKLRVAVLGCGRIAAVYKSALEHLDMETEQAQQLIWLIHSLPELEDASQLSQFLAEPASL